MKRNKTIYKTAIESLRKQREFESKLDNLGFHFEYGEGIFGLYCNDIFNNNELIIRESMGLHIESLSTTCTINGVKHPIILEILYREDHDDDFSITMDDFIDFISELAFKNNDNYEELSELLWKAIVEKDEHAKKLYNDKAKRTVLGTVKK